MTEVHSFVTTTQEEYNTIRNQWYEDYEKGRIARRSKSLVENILYWVRDFRKIYPTATEYSFYGNEYTQESLEQAVEILHKAGYEVKVDSPEQEYIVNWSKYTS